MVKHIVFIKVEGADMAKLQELRALILSMRGKIPSLLHLEVGIDFARTERAYDLALIAEFADKEGLAAYATHPEHTPIIAHLRAIGAQTKVVDYECE